MLLPEILGKHVCFKSRAKGGLKWAASISEVSISFIQVCEVRNQLIFSFFNIKLVSLLKYKFQVDPAEKEEHDKKVKNLILIIYIRHISRHLFHLL